MMPWLGVSLDVAGAAADAFGDALLEAGAQSVAVEGGRMSAVLAADDDPALLVARAARSLGVSVPAFTTVRIADRDWVRASQAQFEPFGVGRLWIGASWHAAPADGRIVARIEPGLAFGTGSHPTTRLVLRFLEERIRGGERVLDYGCGSGILAVAAAKLGAHGVDAVDIDPQAVQATAENAALNAVAVRALAPEALGAAQYDVVVSNILLQPLVLLAPLLAARAAPGARIALAGVLESQAAELAGAYAPWFDLASPLQEDGWALVAGERK
jgi:ribosomal protein L11 methyltransferase